MPVAWNCSFRVGAVANYLNLGLSITVTGTSRTRVRVLTSLPFIVNLSFTARACVVSVLTVDFGRRSFRMARRDGILLLGAISMLWLVVSGLDVLADNSGAEAPNDARSCIAVRNSSP